MSCRCRLVSWSLSPLVICAVGCCVLPLPPCLLASVSFGDLCCGLLCPAAAALSSWPLSPLVIFVRTAIRVGRNDSLCRRDRAGSPPPLLQLIWLRFKTMLFGASARVILGAFGDALERKAIDGLSSSVYF